MFNGSPGTTLLAAFFIVKVLMSASSIIGNLITMLSASTAFGTGGAANDYAVLESTSGSCMVIEFLAVENTEDDFSGGGTRTDWTFSLRGYSKDLGQPQETLARVTGIVDSTLACIKADRTLLGSVYQVTALRANRELPPNGAVTAGGFTWLEVPFELEAYVLEDS